MHKWYGPYHAVWGITTIKPGESGGHNLTVRLTSQQSAGHYELILKRHRVSSFIVTSNRDMDEWLGLFEDPILGNSALDRLANASYQIVIKGSSYRRRQFPHRALLGAGREGGDGPQPAT